MGITLSASYIAYVRPYIDYDTPYNAYDRPYIGYQAAYIDYATPCKALNVGSHFWQRPSATL